MDLMEIRDWIFKKKEILIIVAAIFTFLLMLIIGINLRSKPDKAESPQNVVYLKKPVSPDTSSKNNQTSQESPKKASDQQEEGSQQAYKAYFTQISPEEILERIQEYGEVEAIPDDYKINKLPVGWVVYFFGTGERHEHQIDLQFDTLPTGFGASIISKADLSVYPEFLEMEIGRKIWVAGLIEEVNPDGTGTFTIKADLFGLDGQSPVQKAD